jgi:proteic killer suppression protein
VLPRRKEVMTVRLDADLLEWFRQQRGYQTLIQIHNARNLDDLRAPPGNRLERLSGDRKGQHSIRINDQWRICFRWRDGDAHDVEIVDYH